MKIKNGKIKMSHRERMRMWASILNYAQRESTKTYSYFCRKGLCVRIMNYLHLDEIEGITGRQAMEMVENNFPEFNKYQPPLNTSEIMYWWIPEGKETHQNWWQPRIECVNNILKDLQYKNFPQYHDKYIFPSRLSSSIWEYLTAKEREDCYVYFSSTAHYQFWRFKEAVNGFIMLVLPKKKEQ